MTKRIYQEGENRFMNWQGLCAYLGLGRNSAMKVANDCGATVRFGRSVRYDRNKLDAALEEMAETKGGGTDGNS